MPMLDVFNGSEAAKERWEAGVERELGDQSQRMLIDICEPKTDVTGNLKVWFRIMGASKAVRRNGKFSVVGKSKGGKIRSISLQLEEIIANDSYLDSEVKSTDISLDKELMKNQAESILVDENFIIIDKIEEGVTNGDITEVDGQTEPSIYNNIVAAMTKIIGYTSDVRLVVDRYGWGSMLSDDKLINRDFHDAYLAKNGTIDGMPVAGGKVLFMRNIEEDVYGVDSFLEKGVMYLIGNKAIGAGFAKGITAKSGWDSQEMAYFLQSIAYFNAIVKFPKKIIKLKYKVPENVAKMLTASKFSVQEVVPRKEEAQDPFDSRAAQLDGMSDRDIKALMKAMGLSFAEGETYNKETAVDMILEKEFPEEYVTE